MPKTLRVVGFVWKDGNGVDRNMDISDYDYDYDLIYDDFQECLKAGVVTKLVIIDNEGTLSKFKVDTDED